MISHCFLCDEIHQQRLRAIDSFTDLTSCSGARGAPAKRALLNGLRQELLQWGYGYPEHPETIEKKIGRAHSILSGYAQRLARMEAVKEEPDEQPGATRATRYTNSPKGPKARN